PGPAADLNDLSNRQACRLARMHETVAAGEARAADRRLPQCRTLDFFPVPAQGRGTFCCPAHWSGNGLQTKGSTRA
ncbi:MAG: hypothetical protein QGF48_08530, partial [Qipengyuania citrea]|nr:hypothetical protein [Qipengyuania citrea]